MQLNQTVILPITKVERNKGQIDGLPKNPRIKRDDDFARLKRSIQENPEMLGWRELLVYQVGKKYVTVCGNMRLAAMGDLGFSEVPAKVIAKETTVEELRRLMLKDNANFGEWDMDALANEWNVEQLDGWGLSVPTIKVQDFEDKNNEVDIDSFDEEMVLKMAFTPQQLEFVKSELAKINDSPEQALLIITGWNDQPQSEDYGYDQE